MPAFRDTNEAMLFLLDFMVGIDQHLDRKESRFFTKSALQLTQGDFGRTQEAIQYITQLRLQGTSEALLQEACFLINAQAQTEIALAMLREMAAADGVIHPKEQELFDQICDQLGVARENLRLSS
jgi:tellurite resistance protein